MRHLSGSMKQLRLTPPRYPWPLLAGLTTYRQARTQPLIRTSYLPTTDPRLYSSGFYNFKDSITSTHESFHLVTDTTPAKILARFVLSQAFDNLSALLRKCTWDSEMEKSWIQFVKNTNFLQAICESITLSEELLATAVTMEYCGTPEGQELEEILTNYPEMSLYLQPFRKLIQRNDYSPGTLSLLLLVLQAIKASRSPSALHVHDGAKYGFLVVNSAKRCRIVAERVRDMSNGKECMDWISRTLLKENEFISYAKAWQLFAELRDTSKECYYLWIIMHGQEALKVVDDSKQIRRTHGADRLRVILYPIEIHKEWYVTYTFEPLTHRPQESEALGRILAFESLLDQLIAARGMCCPFYNPLIGCLCDPSWKQSLNRLAQWAKEGKFDHGRSYRGNWMDLPQECRNNCNSPYLTFQMCAATWNPLGLMA
jgi:hypothetical protein